MADGYLGLRQSIARPRPRDGLRGGRLPQHLRVLGRRHRHLHDQRVRAAPGPAASARWTPAVRCRSTPVSPPGWPRRWPGWAWPTPSSPAWRVTTWPTEGPARSPRPSPPSGRPAPQTAVEVLISDCKGDAAVARDHPRRPPGRAQPQHRDGGPAAAGRPSLRRLRPQPDRAGPVGGGRPHHQVGHHPRHGGARGRGARHPGRPGGRSGSTSSPSGSTCVRAPGTCRWPGGGRPTSSTPCAQAAHGPGVRPRPGLAADPFELPRP